jgi:hypothetical protein
MRYLTFKLGSGKTAWFNFFIKPFCAVSSMKQAGLRQVVTVAASTRWDAAREMISFEIRGASK